VAPRCEAIPLLPFESADQGEGPRRIPTRSDMADHRLAKAQRGAGRESQVL